LLSVRLCISPAPNVSVFYAVRVVSNENRRLVLRTSCFLIVISNRHRGVQEYADGLELRGLNQEAHMFMLTLLIFGGNNINVVKNSTKYSSRLVKQIDLELMETIPETPP
jgi:hypothetical protein